LKETGGVIRGARGAAALLGVPESTLRYRLKKLGIERSLRNSSRALRGSSRSVQL